jgi:hypothetical protein
VITRQDLADALTGAGCDGQAYPPDVASAGMAWPVWVGSQPIASGWVITWHCYVTLPGGSAAATIAEADPLTEAVGDALLQVGAVTDIEPVSLATDQAGSAVLPALRITLTTV